MQLRMLLSYLFCLVAMAATAGLPGKDDSLIVIKGTVPSSYNGKTITLFFNGLRGRTFDSTVITGGGFELRDHLPRSVTAILSVKSPGAQLADQYRTVYMDPGYTVTVSGSGKLDDLDIKGCPSQDDWAVLERSTRELKDQLNPVSIAMWDKTKSDSERNEAEEKAAAITKDLYRVENRFVAAHPESFVSWYLVNNRSMIVKDDDSLGVAFDALSPKYKNTPAGQAMEARIKAGVRVGMGKMAPDFVAMDTLGNPVSLSSFKGKYVIVDFWASWCGFCRAENPNLLKAYNRFKEENFTIVSVSYDDTRDKWLGAVREDKLPWAQISELKALSSAPSAKEYGIDAIPQIFLLDPTGKIIAKELRGDQAERKLKEIFGEK